MKIKLGVKKIKKTNAQKLQEMCDEELWFADGYDNAIIGLDMGSGCKVVYDYEECIKCLIDEGLEPQDAYDHFHYNTLGSHIGESTPIYVWYLKDEINN
tara:strand:- start:73 stop:369 length:297 start_codon:yes stop_codon:yes gene_type:complete